MTRRQRRDSSPVSAGGARAEGTSAIEVSRSIPLPVQRVLWGRAAGRCEFAGCNKALWKSSITQEPVNIAQAAHIYSFSEAGPRGRGPTAADAIHSVGNLLLVCHECHRKIDQQDDGGRYTADLLKRMKALHEERIELVTGIAPENKSHILLYGANVGDHGGPLNYRAAAPALFPSRYPADDKPIELTTVNSAFTDMNDDFWTLEAQALRTKYERRVRERVTAGELTHLSVFALAPQPLLILLGTLIGDIVPADVYQRHREPPTWEWPAMAPVPEFRVTKPERTSGAPALVLALSATVTTDRITSILGDDASIWTVTVAAPHNDLTKSRNQLAVLRGLLRRLFDQIKADHGQATPLHVFPVMSVSAAVEFGRVRAPKADMPWRIYDQVNRRGGFVSALSIE